MSANVQMGTIETRVPARLDRLPWARFHWLVVIGLGTVWILDGLEVTIVGSIASRLTEKGSGIVISTSQIGTAAAFYVAGACLGALFFGQLTDRFGRKKLFVITLGVYLLATVATAFAPSALYFFIARFFTGAGIGGEYAAINSAIDELIPARVRGRVDLIINGSYWVGAALGAVGSLLLLDQNIFATDIGWRIAFAIGALLGLGILLVRRHVPESPRWLFIHGREEEAEAIVSDIERNVEQETGERLDEPGEVMTVRQRKTIPFREIARTAFKRYPRRTTLGFALFIGQAFIYNAITFDLGTLLSTFFKVSSGAVPFYLACYAISNFLGPVLLGRLFDTVGRKPMVTATYLGSAAITVVLTIMFMSGSLGVWGFMGLLLAVFFLASAGASAAYLTVSEIFPMETRALSIAFFYAIGTAIGGITGPLVFSHLISSGDATQAGIGFLVGAAVMTVGGIAEIFFGVKAEQRRLEDIAKPLTAEEAEAEVPERRAAPAPPRRGRLRPGPSTRGGYSPGMPVSEQGVRPELAREVERIEAALSENGTMDRAELARAVGARFWGPGRFSAALGEAVANGRAHRVGRHSFAAGGRQARAGGRFSRGEAAQADRPPQAAGRDTERRDDR